MRKVILFFGMALLVACSEDTEMNSVTENQEETQIEVLSSETMSAYRKAVNSYLYQKDNPDFSQDNLEKIVLEEAKALLEEYGEPDLDEYFGVDAKNEDELIVKKAFERYVELSKIKK